MIHPSRERISLRPLASCARPTWASLRSDLQAGLTVAIFAVPQAMAYAVLAGVPPVNGLYCAVVMSFVASLFGSSPFLNTGPTNTASLLMASVIAPFSATATPENVLPMVWQFTLLVGALRLLMGILKAGPLVRLVPEHAVLGFVTAANLLIALGQFHEMLGVDSPKGAGTLNKIIGIAAEVPQTQWSALAVGLMTLALMMGFDRFSRRFPVTLCAVMAATLAALALERWMPDAPHVALVSDVAPIPAGFPLPRVYTPDLSLMWPMLPGAAAVAIIGLLESASISSTLALKNKRTVNFNQEFFGQGMAQIATAFFSGFPGSASYSRSALIERNGGQTMLAGVFFSAMTLAALLIGAQVLGAIPLTALAALLVFTGIKLVDMAALRRVWKFSRADFTVVALTFGVTFFGNLQWGFFAGIVAALLVFVARAKTLQLYELIPRGGKWEERLYTVGSDHPRSDVVALALHGDLFFGMAHELREQLGEIVREQQPRWIIVRMRRASSVDASIWNTLADFAATFDEKGGQLILSGLSPRMESLIERTEMRDLVPSANLLPQEGRAFVAFEKGLERIGAEIGPDTVLSQEWNVWAQQYKTRESVSHWRDPANDPATLGAIEI